MYEATGVLGRVRSTQQISHIREVVAGFHLVTFRNHCNRVTLKNTNFLTQQIHASKTELSSCNCPRRLIANDLPHNHIHITKLHQHGEFKLPNQPIQM